MSQIPSETHIRETPETSDPLVVELALNYRSVSTVYTFKGKVSVMVLAQDPTWNYYRQYSKKILAAAKQRQIEAIETARET